MCNFKIKCNGCGKYLTYLLTDVYKLSQDIIVVLQEKMINFTLDTDPKIGLADQYLFYFINCLYCQKLVGELIFSSNEQYERYINCCFIYSLIVTVEESNESEVTTALEEIASIIHIINERFWFMIMNKMRLFILTRMFLIIILIIYKSFINTISTRRRSAIDNFT